MTVKEQFVPAMLTMTMRYSQTAPDHRMRAIKTLDSAHPTDTNTDTEEYQGSGKCRQHIENGSGSSWTRTSDPLLKWNKAKFLHSSLL